MSHITSHSLRDRKRRVGRSAANTERAHQAASDIGSQFKPDAPPIAGERKPVGAQATPDFNPDYTGLSSAEAARLLESGQGNAPLKKSTRSVRQIIAENLFTYFNFLNLVLAAVVFIVSLQQPQYFKNLIFLVIITVNIGIGTVQEIKAKRTLDRLAILTEPRAKVLRDGHETDIPTSELVPGDLLHVQAGKQISIDGVLLRSVGLEVDESLLTGEADAIAKPPGTSILSGSVVMAGEGFIRVDKVSGETFAAQITAEARQEKRRLSSLMRSLNHLIKIISWILFPLGLLLIGKQFYLHRHVNLAPHLISTVGVLVSMIPQGLILLTSVAFAVSVMKLGRKMALVQDMSSIDSLARVDTLCLDKTGTVTTGSMNLLGIIPLGVAEDAGTLRPTGFFPLHKDATASLASLSTASFSTAKKSVGDSTPFEVFPDLTTLDALPPAVCEALSALAAVFPEGNATQTAINACFHAGSSDDWNLETAYPFSSQRKWSGASFAGRGCWFSGAGEILLHGDDVQDCLSLIRHISANGYRVIVLCHAAQSPIKDSDGVLHVPGHFQPQALLLISDEIRSDAAETFAYFRSQGVELKMISGDSPLTVQAIAKRAGVSGMNELIDMSQVGGSADYAEIAASHQLFGRVSPFQKRELLRALQQAGHVVAMTGDGVNDVLALKEADCGIAMASGSDAARAAADIVLLDNHMAVMVDALYEGRRVINNIQRMASLFLVKTTYATVFALMMVIFPIHYPLYPIQATLISSSTVGIPAFFLALKANRERVSGSFMANVLPRVLPAGLSAAICLLGLQYIAHIGAFSHAEMRTFSLVILVVIGLRTLFDACVPFDVARGILFACCAAIPTIGIIFAPNFFMIAQMSENRLWFLMIPQALLALGLSSLFYYLVNMPSLRRLIRSYLGYSKEDIQDAENERERQQIRNQYRAHLRSQLQVGRERVSGKREQASANRERHPQQNNNTRAPRHDGRASKPTDKP